MVILRVKWTNDFSYPMLSPVISRLGLKLPLKQVLKWSLVYLYLKRNICHETFYAERGNCQKVKSFQKIGNSWSEPLFPGRIYLSDVWSQEEILKISKNKIQQESSRPISPNTQNFPSQERQPFPVRQNHCKCKAKWNRFNRRDCC